MIWKKAIDLKELNEWHKNSMVDFIGIVFTEVGDDFIKATLPVNERTMQPQGRLHGAANIIFRKEISGAEDPVTARNQKIEEYRDKFSNPYVAASRGYVDDVIEPAYTRVRIIMALEMLDSKRENRPAKKHGNIPL